MTLEHSHIKTTKFNCFHCQHIPTTPHLILLSYHSLYMNVYIHALLCHNKVVGSQPRSPQSGHRPCTDDLVKRTGLQLHVYTYLWEGRLRWEIYHPIIPLRAIHIIRYTCTYKLYNYVTFPKHIMYRTITHKM